MAFYLQVPRVDIDAANIRGRAQPFGSARPGRQQLRPTGNSAPSVFDVDRTQLGLTRMGGAREGHQCCAASLWQFEHRDGQRWLPWMRLNVTVGGGGAHLDVIGKTCTAKS
jgi:hypothetical protein